jgi:hypothetical protein
MHDFKIKDVLIEHSNALREMLRASRAHNKDEAKHIKVAVNHVKSMIRLLDKYSTEDVPPETRERAGKAVSYLENGDIDEGRAVLLEMGRRFDDFLKNDHLNL